MEKAAGFLIAILFLIIGVAVAGSFLLSSAERSTRAQANLEYARGQARAMIIEAQGQARLDSAQAWAVTSAASLPWGVLLVVGLLGVALMALCLVVIVRPPQIAPPTQTLLPPVQHNYYLLVPKDINIKQLTERSPENDNARS